MSYRTLILIFIILSILLIYSIKQFGTNPNLYASLIGAISAGFFTFLGTLFSNFLNHQKEKRLLLEQKKEIALSLICEADSIIESFKKAASEKDKTQEGSKEKLLIMLIESNYTSVYDSICGRLGLLEDEKLIKNTIFTYTRIKALIDTIRTQNNYANEYIRSYVDGCNKTGNDRAPTGSLSLLKVMNSYQTVVDETIEEVLILSVNLTKDLRGIL